MIKTFVLQLEKLFEKAQLPDGNIDLKKKLKKKKNYFWFRNLEESSGSYGEGVLGGLPMKDCCPLMIMLEFKQSTYVREKWEWKK